MNTMKKEDWEQVYKELKEIYSHFLGWYQESNNGKNKKVRGAAHMEARQQIGYAERLIKKHPEAYYLLTSRGLSTQKGEGSEVADIFFMDEFTKPHYFERDMRRYFYDIEAKLQAFDV